MSKLLSRHFYYKFNKFQFKKCFNNFFNKTFCDMNKFMNESNSNNKNIKAPLKIFYFGNDDVSLSPLETLFSIHKNTTLNLISEINVVTTPHSPGNKTQLKFHNFLRENNIKCEYIVNDNWNDITEKINRNELNSKAAFVCSFGKMIPSDIITSFELIENKGIYVIHPSLLPKYRGGAPIQHTLLNNEKETGVSLIKTSKNKFDAGEVLMQSKIKIENYHTFKELSIILSNEGAKLLGKFILEKYFFINDQEKPILETNKSFAKIISDKKFVYLDFTNQICKDILKIFRAFNGSQLSPFCKLKFGKHVKLTLFENLFESNPKVTEKMFSDKIVKEYTFPGCIYWDFNIDPLNIYIRTVDGWMISSQIKMEGYDTLNAKDFVNRAFKNQRVNKSEKKMYVGVISKNDVIF